MKTLAHLAGFSLALVVAGLGSGCASSTPTATYRQPAQDFEVVESSAKRPLTDSEKAEVRASVASYLDREGATEGGDYFLKVYLTPENVDAESEWVVVRFTRYTTQRVAVVDAYSYDYATYAPYYSYDIYPYGYGCVSRIAFQYYVDPFYHNRYYYPRYGYGRKGDHDHGNAHNGGGKPGQPGGNHGPGTRPPTVPPIAQNPSPNENRNSTYPRQSPPAGGGKQHYEDIQKKWRGRPGVDAGPSGLVNAGNRTGVDPKREDSPPPQQPDRPATAAPATQSYGNQPVPTRQRNANPGSPTGVNNSQRTADRAAPTGNRPQQANRSTPASYRPAPSSSRPAYSAPARASAPAASQPARSAPPSSSGGNERKQDSDGQRESLR